MTEPFIELRDIDLTLGHDAAQVHVLDAVTFTVAQGETVGVTGPSGSGKSTLLMVLAGLEKADSGSVRIAGACLDRMHDSEIARFRGRNIGIVFQSFHLFPTMTALENTAVPLELAGRKDAFEAARQELEAVGLGRRLHHYPGMLSGGEQQRVAIARALAPQPHILVADEPTGNLDSATGRRIADLLFERISASRLTMVLVTHDPALAARCDRQVRLCNGKMTETAGKAAP